MFYDAKVVNIVRNPFDVAISIKKVPWGTDNIVDISKRWRKYVKLALRYRKMFKRYFYTVNYEDIIYDPEAEICKICEFLSVDFENRMLEFYRNKDVPIFYKNRYWHKNCFRPISADNIGKGFRELNLQEIKFIAYYCIKYLRLLGYEDLLAKYAEEIGRNSKNNKKVLCDILEIVEFKHIPLAKNNLYRISAFIKRKLALYKRQ